MQQGLVVVGVDGSPPSDNAVRWATRLAARRHAELLIIHGADLIGYEAWTATPAISADPTAMTRPIVDRAIALAKSVDSTVEVTGRVVLGSPSWALLNASRSAEALVLGRTGRGRIATTLLGSVCHQVMAQAQCPVVTVEARQDEADELVRRVVVGVEDEHTSTAAIEFGTAAASDYGVPLSVVHAWPDPASTLAQVCGPGDLLVIGAHRHQPHHPVTAGRLAAELCRRLPGPLAVVGTPAPATSGAGVPS